MTDRDDTHPSADDLRAEHAALRAYVHRHYRHFNARSLRRAAEAWRDQLDQGHRMMVTLAGAMSTAELGVSLAELIRRDKVHAICCTGANLEEDVFNLVAHDHYEEIPAWRALTAEQEQALADRGMNRVTDTCIPEEEAMRRIERAVRARWRAADVAGERKLPHRYLYEILLSGELAAEYQIDPRDSWLMAAAERDLPLFVPGWEDSTLGNMFVACQLAGEISTLDVVLSGLHTMRALIDWYRATTAETRVGFFQIGGGIAGDFPICVVPLIRQDLKLEVPLWSYFCQISDSTTSYGSYSGAVPNEKITWGKLAVDTPSFIIESDATIVAPLMFSMVLAD
ncbi:MAG: deoxyhypusine synthase family protein [Acidobacteriota bacterium]